MAARAQRAATLRRCQGEPITRAASSRTSGFVGEQAEVRCLLGLWWPHQAGSQVRALFPAGAGHPRLAGPDYRCDSQSQLGPGVGRVPARARPRINVLDRKCKGARLAGTRAEFNTMPSRVPGERGETRDPGAPRRISRRCALRPSESRRDGLRASGDGGLLPPPLWGKGGVVVVERDVSANCYPHPNPSPQGGESTPNPWQHQNQNCDSDSRIVTC
jgi:hypothetical protein